MPRYFFEIETPDFVFEDPDGMDYPTDEAATWGADRLATELALETPELVGSTLKLSNDAEEVLGTFIIKPPNELLQ